MPTFPTLKTGTIAQYPIVTGFAYKTTGIQFLDGSRQTYQLAAPARTWRISLNLLDTQECATLVRFAEQYGSSYFSFNDPLGGQVVPKCCFANPTIQRDAISEGRFRADVVIREVV